MDALILVGVIVVVAGGILGAALWLTRVRPGDQARAREVLGL